MKSLEAVPEKVFCLCGSIKFSPEMKRIARILEEAGKVAVLPKSVIELDEETAVSENYDRVGRKREIDAIKIHFDKIAEADAILVCNYAKNGVENYIGANTFLEMGFAHYARKKIYLIAPLPDMRYINDELFAFDVEVIGGLG
jgi:hypothetical protein